MTARALPDLMDIVRENQGGNVLVVSHKATIRLLLSSLLGFDPRRYFAGRFRDGSPTTALAHLEMWAESDFATLEGALASRPAPDPLLQVLKDPWLLFPLCLKTKT